MTDVGKWDARYRDVDLADVRALSVLEQNAHLLPTQGLALDLACGLGASARLLAARGLETLAWDLSPIAVERINADARDRGLPLVAEPRDVERAPPEPDRFDVIVVGHFLERSLAEPIVRALRPGGLLFYQTFTDERVDEIGPSRPEYRLRPNELLRLFESLRVLVYREEGRIGDLSLGFRNEAMLVARRETATDTGAVHGHDRAL